MSSMFKLFKVTEVKFSWAARTFVLFFICRERSRPTLLFLNLFVILPYFCMSSMQIDCELLVFHKNVISGKGGRLIKAFRFQSGKV